MNLENSVTNFGTLQKKLSVQQKSTCILFWKAAPASPRRAARAALTAAIGAKFLHYGIEAAETLAL